MDVVISVWFYELPTAAAVRDRPPQVNPACGTLISRDRRGLCRRRSARSAHRMCLPHTHRDGAVSGSTTTSYGATVAVSASGVTVGSHPSGPGCVPRLQWSRDVAHSLADTTRCVMACPLPSACRPRISCYVLAEVNRSWSNRLAHGTPVR